MKGLARREDSSQALALVSPQEISTTGACKLRMAGVIENAVEVEVVELKRGLVLLRVRAGDDDAHEIWLNQGSIWKCNLHLKTTNLGLQ